MQEKYYVQPPRGGLKPGLSFGYVDVPQHLTPDKRPFLDSLTKASLEVQQQIRKGREIDIPTRDVWIDANGRKTMLRLFLPQGEGPFPLVLYCHGGGFAIRNVDALTTLAGIWRKTDPLWLLCLNMRLLLSTLSLHNWNSVAVHYAGRGRMRKSCALMKCVTL